MGSEYNYLYKSSSTTYSHNQATQKLKIKYQETNYFKTSIYIDDWFTNLLGRVSYYKTLNTKKQIGFYIEVALKDLKNFNSPLSKYGNTINIISLQTGILYKF